MKSLLYPMLTPKEFMTIAERVDNSSLNVTYSHSYPVFLEFFSSRTNITESDLILAAEFTYGWMPTIINFHNLEFDKILTTFNSLRDLSKDQLNSLPDDKIIQLLDHFKSFMNNSMVGSSKILHFSSPGVYPIWDSKVYLAARNQKTSFGIDRADYYLCFTRAMHGLIAELDDSTLQSIKDKFSQYLPEGQFMSDLRAIELILFLS